MAEESNLTNSIRPTKRPRKAKRVAHEESVAPPDAGGRTTGPAPIPNAKNRDAIPEGIREKFTQVGNKYHFKDGALAFTDRGDRLTSPSENTEVIKSLVTIAKEREWTDITVTGTERFRRDAWFAARLVHLEVRGYAPSEYDQARAARAIDRDSVSEVVNAARETDLKPVRARPAERELKARQDRLYLGVLIEHGSAPYKHDDKNSVSYFVRLETAEGERELWGIDLQRALNESASRPQRGDAIGVRAVRRDAVKVRVPNLDADGKVIGETQVEKQRTAWIIESQTFFKARSEVAATLENSRVDQQQAVKRHPELVGTYLQIHAAELAAKAIRDPEDQRRFVALVRASLANSIRRGEPLPPVRLREPVEPAITPAKRPTSIERESSPSR
jgi:hypothetical protein